MVASPAKIVEKAESNLGNVDSVRRQLMASINKGDKLEEMDGDDTFPGKTIVLSLSSMEVTGPRALDDRVDSNKRLEELSPRDCQEIRDEYENFREELSATIKKYLSQAVKNLVAAKGYIRR